MNEYYILKRYLKAFEEKNNDPYFLKKYYSASSLSEYKNTLQRIKYISVYCGCDYTNIYNPLFHYSRFYHSLVVANMTWHFTHNKKETIAALFHDAGTPCFSHTIDYLLGDSKNQESSERSIIEVLKNDKLTIDLLKSDGIELDELNDLLNNPILENKSPKLCTDRLDGVFGTCFIWLHTHKLSEIKEVYDDLTVLENEYGIPEIGFKSIEYAEEFSKMVEVYANELQSNRDKFVLQYIADIVKLAVNNNLISLEDLYKLKERDLVELFRNNFSSWYEFKTSSKVISANKKPNNYSISVEAKKRNVIPLVKVNNKIIRIDEVSKLAHKIYKNIDNYNDKKYGYVKNIKTLN